LQQILLHFPELRSSQYNNQNLQFDGSDGVHLGQTGVFIGDASGHQVLKKTENSFISTD
jgi:hypothetical protein